MSDGNNGEEEGEGGKGDGDKGGGQRRGRRRRRQESSGSHGQRAACMSGNDSGMEKERAGAVAEPSIVFCLN